MKTANVATLVRNAIVDNTTMTLRNLRHNLRMPTGIIMTIIIPLIFLLLFVYVFGETLGAGIAPGGAREDYLSYITPAILLMAAASATQMITVWISTDMTEGIIARFRTMDISRSSVLAGHVYGGVLLVFFTVAALLGLAISLGYRPTATISDWTVFLGFIFILGISLAWLSVALGLAAQGPETASNMTLLLMILPLLSNGFVPTESLPTWLQGFAKHQPFTPIIETIRDLLTSNVDISTSMRAIGWCFAIGAFGYIWSQHLYNKRGARR